MGKIKKPANLALDGFADLSKKRIGRQAVFYNCLNSYFITNEQERIRYG